MAESILIVDDEVLTLKNLKKALEKEGYEVLLADTGESGIEIYRKNRSNVALVDLMLPGIDGIEVLKKIKEIDPNTVVIMITAYEIIEKAVEAMKLGAYDYLLKPFKIADLKTRVARALELQSLKIRVSETVETEKGKYYFDRIIAESRKMIDVVETARKIALLGKTSVLITGESGVGKGLIARAIHYNSPRVDQQFVEINCAAIPENLLESELYGYEPGAFTDARRRKIGLFEKADHGTIFLDEIADMPLPLQAKVLKVLEEQSFTRLGGTNVIKIDVRFVTASNKDLKKEIQEGNFREDLFYRLNVVPITVPPLKARKEDIVPLVLLFIQELNQELHKSFKGVSEEAAKVFLEYEWPGNVRELRNVIERIMALHHAEEILLEHVPLEIRTPVVRGETKILKEIIKTQQFVTLDELEKQYIKQVVSSTGGNKSKAAKILGIHLTSLFRKLKSM
ncbi:Fis family transcriptional regulator [candidate division WOR_3 bacterium SM1_77]|uniref:Fis family transcriptional regulator n=1 Tax=candidate division WOR_3 bacterium SM1_77 TaxID=1703778 RepID=A0A0S8JZK6_UNCW3|nr:MAG: Fis family transcriptional regulator [candidate division WOR_3 bacterium SM1_77]